MDAACIGDRVPSDGNVSDVIEIIEDAKYRNEHGGLLDMTDRWGFTALIEASMFGHLPIVEILVDNGADILHKTKAGETALTSVILFFTLASSSIFFNLVSSLFKSSSEATASERDAF